MYIFCYVFFSLETAVSETHLTCAIHVAMVKRVPNFDAVSWLEIYQAAKTAICSSQFDLGGEERFSLPLSL